MSVHAAQITVSGTAVQLTPVIADQLPGYRIVMMNTGATDVFIGGAEVTTSNGFRLAMNQQLMLEPHHAEKVYARTAGTSTIVHVIATGVTQ